MVSRAIEAENMRRGIQVLVPLLGAREGEQSLQDLLKSEALHPQVGSLVRKAVMQARFEGIVAGIGYAIGQEPIDDLVGFISNARRLEGLVNPDPTRPQLDDSFKRLKATDLI